MKSDYNLKINQAWFWKFYKLNRVKKNPAEIFFFHYANLESIKLAIKKLKVFPR